MYIVCFRLKRHINPKRKADLDKLVQSMEGGFLYFILFFLLGGYLYRHCIEREFMINQRMVHPPPKKQ